MANHSNHLKYNLLSCDNEDGMSYIYKPTQEKRIQIAIRLLKEELTQSKTKKNLLSIGCSTGIIEVQFKKMGLVVYGVDAAPLALKEASKRGVITTCADISKKLPFKDSFFDFVFAGEIIEHIMNTRFLLTEIHRVLKRNGVVIITTPNLARFEDRIRFLFGQTPKHTTPIHDYLYLHVRPFTLDSLKKALIFCQFGKLKYESNYVYFMGIKAGIISRVLAKMFPGLGKTIIMKAERL